jgi:Ca2+-binding EF-hand superfamily protein
LVFNYSFINVDSKIPISQHKLRIFLEFADKDKNGKLNFEEFKKAYKKTKQYYK